MTQVVECLPCKSKALSSNPSTTKIKKVAEMPTIKRMEEKALVG
jgi:hypothetical protein